MEPTIRKNDRVLGNKLAYVRSNPALGDIVLFKMPKEFGKDAGSSAIKRIVAVSGEAVQLKGSSLYVDGKKRTFRILENENGELKYAKNEANVIKVPPAYVISGVSEPYLVPDGSYFLLGDNLQNSADSRYFGAVSKDVIIGKVVKIYWPPQRMGTLY